MATSMDFGGENATRLSWRSAPELLINEESLVEVIAKLRAQVLALERNELLSGTALPPWLLKALTEVANNVDAVVECQSLQEQVNGLQKEVLELRHELLLQQSASNNNGGAPFNPTPHHRLSTNGRVASRRAPSTSRNASITKNSELPTSSEAEANTGDTSSTGGEPEAINMELALKPLWDAIHRQTNDFSSLKDSFGEAKDTVARLQSEIKRRDAVVQARNSKHEAVVQSQVEKLNESLRACVTRNDLIGAEQRIAQQMKLDRQRLMEDVEGRSNKMLEDILTSRADQEDVNSMNGELIEKLTRKQARMEDQVIDLMKKHTEGQQNINEMRVILADAVTRVDQTTATMELFQEKVASFEETQRIVTQHTEDMKKGAEANDNMRAELETRLVEKIGESVNTVRGELQAVNYIVMDLVSQNLDSELKALSSKVEVAALNIGDTTKKLSNLQKQVNGHEEHTKTQFTQVFDSIDRVLSNMSTISEESMRLGYTLAQTVDHGNALQQELTDHKSATDKHITSLNRSTQDLNNGLEKHIKSTENEIILVKNQLFHVEDVNSTLKREIESTQNDMEVNLRNQMKENQLVKGSLDSLFIARDELSGRQDAAQAQMFALQAENRAEIQAATAKLVAIVDKSSNRVEALYATFQEKQEHFADVVARSSIRNMDLNDMNRELDRICESFVSECWKFETSARTNTKTSARPDNNNNGSTQRKLFNERQQQLLVKNCQFFADLMVARAEYEVLHNGCNKEVKNQQDMDELMLDAQESIVEKMKMKITTKIMNNKNIGEQFDKSTLDRRELYIETVSNMVDASMQRRTMGGIGGRGGAGGGRGGGGGGGFRLGEDLQDGIREDLSSGSFLETQRLVGTASALPGSRRRSSVRKQPSTLSSPASDLDSSRSAFTPGSSYVYRAGFRLPKAAQSSPPNSPITPLTKGLTTPLGTMSENGDNPIFISSPYDGDGMPQDGLNGWVADDNGGAMSKSISLPALRPNERG